MENKKKITGIVLAGGKSSRMGYDKGLALVEGRKIIERELEVLSKVVDEVIIIANSDTYNYLNLPVYEDLYKEKGPVGGIYTGLYYSKSEINLIVACDMPFIAEGFLHSLIQAAGTKQIVIPSVNERLEPLCGIYKRNIIEELKGFIEKDELSVHKVMKHFDYEVLQINESDIQALKGFTNINKPEDLNL